RFHLSTGILVLGRNASISNEHRCANLLQIDYLMRYVFATRGVSQGLRVPWLNGAVLTSKAECLWPQSVFCCRNVRLCNLLGGELECLSSFERPRNGRPTVPTRVKLAPKISRATFIWTMRT